MTGSIKLRDYKTEMVRLSCDRCGRIGQYRKENLVAEFGPDIALADLRHEIARCERHQKTGDACAVRYIGLRRSTQAAPHHHTATTAVQRREFGGANLKCFLIGLIPSSAARPGRGFADCAPARRSSSARARTGRARGRPRGIPPPSAGGDRAGNQGKDRRPQSARRSARRLPDTAYRQRTHQRTALCGYSADSVSVLATAGC